MVKSPNLPEPLVAHFWDPVEATPVEITKPTTDAKKALTTLKTRVVKAEIAKSVREKHAQYGVTQAYFEKPENADKKAILESKLGIDLDTNPINSDAFIGALAHFQDEHKGEIGYGYDGWFAPDVDGKGPTPTWKAMFDGVIVPSVSVPVPSPAPSIPKSAPDAFEGIDRLDVAAMKMLDGLRYVTYDRQHGQFVSIPTNDRLSRDDGAIPRKKEAITKWVQDHNADYLIRPTDGSTLSDKLILGITYNENTNTYDYLGYNISRDNQTLDTLRKWQNEHVPRHIVSQMGGDKLKKAYDVWSPRPSDFSFAQAFNGIIPFWNPYDTQRKFEGKESTDAAKTGKASEAHQLHDIFTRIRDNKKNPGYPPEDLLPPPPEYTFENLGVTPPSDPEVVNWVNIFQFLYGNIQVARIKTSLGLAPNFSGPIPTDRVIEALAKKNPKDFAKLKTTPNTYFDAIKSYALTLAQSREIVKKTQPYTVDRFQGDTLLLSNVLTRLEKAKTESDTARDALRWGWDTTSLQSTTVWQDALQQKIDDVKSCIEGVKRKAEGENVNRGAVDAKIKNFDDLIKGSSSETNKTLYRSQKKLWTDLDTTLPILNQVRYAQSLDDDSASEHVHEEMPFVLSSVFVDRVLACFEVKTGQKIDVDTSDIPGIAHDEMDTYIEYMLYMSDTLPTKIPVSQAFHTKWMKYLNEWKSTPKKYDDFRNTIFGPLPQGSQQDCIEQIISRYMENPS